MWGSEDTGNDHFLRKETNLTIRYLRLSKQDNGYSGGSYLEDFNKQIKEN